MSLLSGTGPGEAASLSHHKAHPTLSKPPRSTGLAVEPRLWMLRVPFAQLEEGGRRAWGLGAAQGL